jgi:hypothetical protein
MVEGNYIFQTVLTSKAHLVIARLLEEVDLYNRTETFIKETSMATKHKVKEYLEILEECIKDNLRMVKFMEMVFTKEKMEYFSKEGFRMDNNHKVNLFGEPKINTLIKEY